MKHSANPSPTSNMPSQQKLRPVSRNTSKRSDVKLIDIDELSSYQTSKASFTIMGPGYLVSSNFDEPSTCNTTLEQQQEYFDLSKWVTPASKTGVFT